MLGLFFNKPQEREIQEPITSASITACTRTNTTIYEASREMPDGSLCRVLVRAPAGQSPSALLYATLELFAR